MKKINVYEFNDGLDGVVTAKSFKHACKILAREYGISHVEMMNNFKGDPECIDTWFYDDNKISKSKMYRKSYVVGYGQ